MLEAKFRDSNGLVPVKKPYPLQTLIYVFFYDEFFKSVRDNKRDTYISNNYNCKELTCKML